MATLYAFSAELIDGSEKKLEDYSGKTLLIVNTASNCGYTPQYQGLEAIYNQFKSRGLEILAFPCNQFGSQEPGSSEEIKNFCLKNYQVSFPIFNKVEVNGKHSHPLFDHLKEQAPGIFNTKRIKWNFTKFLVNSKGDVIKRFAPMTKPEDLEEEILAIL